MRIAWVTAMSLPTVFTTLSSPLHAVMLHRDDSISQFMKNLSTPAAEKPPG